MRTVIEIKGQIQGNSTLRNAIVKAGSQDQRTNNGGYRIEFNTKKEARRALWDAYRKIRQDEPGEVSYSPGTILSYDASTARISEGIIRDRISRLK